jgi:archaellum component FlaC
MEQKDARLKRLEEKVKRLENYYAELETAREREDEDHEASYIRGLMEACQADIDIVREEMRRFRKEFKEYNKMKKTVEELKKIVKSQQEDIEKATLRIFHLMNDVECLSNSVKLK